MTDTEGRVQNHRDTVARQHYHLNLHPGIAVAGHSAEEVVRPGLEVGDWDSGVNTWDGPYVKGQRRKVA